VRRIASGHEHWLARNEAINILGTVAGGLEKADTDLIKIASYDEHERNRDLAFRWLEGTVEPTTERTPESPNRAERRRNLADPQSNPEAYRMAVQSLVSDHKAESARTHAENIRRIHVLSDLRARKKIK
jgi:hypothetical protein